MTAAGKFATDKATVFHKVKTDNFGVSQTETLKLDKVLVSDTEAQGDSTMGNSPNNLVKLLYYPGKSTINGCYIRALGFGLGDIVALGSYDSQTEATDDGAYLLKIRSVTHCGHLARLDHWEVLCG